VSSSSSHHAHLHILAFSYPLILSPSRLNSDSVGPLWLQRGCKADLSVMEDEIIMAMRLLGVRKIDEITPGMVECLKEVWR
jgi:hypothetical protein